MSCSEAFSVDDELSGFLLRGGGAGGAPQKDFRPPKRRLPPLKFSRKQQKVCSVLLRVSLACERREERKGEEKEELSSSHIYYTLSRQEKFHKDFKRKIR